MVDALVAAVGQVQWAGLVIGAGPLRLRSLEGWEELPDLDDGSALYSGQHGSSPGPLLAQSRTVTAELIVRVTADQVGVTVAELNAATRLRDTEQPLVVWLDSRGPLVAYGRVIRRRLPVDRTYRVGTIVGATLQWSCSDPRRYGAADQVAATGLPQPEGGLEWTSGLGGLEWTSGVGGLAGLDWGTTGVTGTVTVTNAGDAPTSPTIEWRGPVDLPSVVRLSDGVRLEYDVTLAAGETLVVDTRTGTVLLDGADRLYTATARSVPEQWWALEPGATDLAFRAAPESSDPAASMTVRWRSAYW